MEFVIFSLAVLAFIVVSLFMPWVLRSRIADLEEDVKRIKRQLASDIIYDNRPGAPAQVMEPQLHYGAPKQERVDILATPAPVPAPIQEWKPVTSPMPEMQKPAPSEEKTIDDFLIAQEAAKPKVASRKLSFEQQFGARLPVWVGGIALALAGFYLVKYSIETGLLSPMVRVAIGIAFGIGLLFAGHKARGKTGIANGQRIGQALAGAGIADLYVCLFAATSLYQLVHPAIGFIGMAITTATAVVLSIRHGAPIALLGLIGGFLTPALVGSNDPNAPVLFIYLYFVVTGLFAVIKRQNWWLLAVPTVLGAFLWVALWLGGSYSPADGIWLGLFLIAVSATVVINSKKAIEDGTADITDAYKVSSALNYLTMGGAVLLMGAVTVKSGFGLMEWGLFALLALGGIGLAFFNQKIYGFVPWLTMAVNAVMLLMWKPESLDMFAGTLVIFATLYSLSAYVLMWRSKAPVLWAGLFAGTTLTYYLIAYDRLLAYSQSADLMVSGLPIWGITALFIALIATAIVKEVMVRFTGSEEEKQRLLAVFAATATAFLSLGMGVELQREFLSVAFAAEVLALAWINNHVKIDALRAITTLVACAFGVLLLPQILLLMQLTAYSLAELRFSQYQGVPIVNWPLFQLGLPAALFAGATLLLRKQKDDGLVRALEVSCVALITVMGYYLIRHAFHIDENVLFVKAGFFERGVITNVLFVYGLICLWMGRHFTRPALSLCGTVLSVIALLRIAYFDLFLYNPMHSHQLIGATPIFNALLLPFGLPIVWLVLANREIKALGKEGLLRYTGGFLLLLVFSLVTFNVRQFFHGEYLDVGVVTNAEVYSYSVAWLLLGIALLFTGTLKKDKMIRIASLAIMILTVGKVFLYDASELEGLFRVFSFLGLGVSLIGLSWFYTRFVFNSREE